MKQLSNDAVEALEIIKEKAMFVDSRLNKDEFLALKYVYEEINLVFNNKKLTIKEGCSGCIPNALKIVKNYINLSGISAPIKTIEESFIVAEVEKVEIVVNVPEEEVNTNNKSIKKKQNGKRRRK